MTTEMTVLYMLCFLILTSKGKKEKKKKRFTQFILERAAQLMGRAMQRMTKNKRVLQMLMKMLEDFS